MGGKPLFSSVALRALQHFELETFDIDFQQRRLTRKRQSIQCLDADPVSGLPVRHHAELFAQAMIQRKGSDIRGLLIIDVWNVDPALRVADRQMKCMQVFKSIDEYIAAQLVEDDPLGFVGQHRSARSDQPLRNRHRIGAQVGAHVDDQGCFDAFTERKTDIGNKFRQSVPIAGTM